MGSNTNSTDFVKAYMSNNGDVVATATQLGVTYTAVKMRVKLYRKRGIKLPAPRYRHGTTLNVKELNNLIATYKENK